jgi:hypothetical protein
MSSKHLLIAAGVCSVIILSGCSNTVHKTIGQEDLFLGEAARYNAALQTINPDPVYAEDALEAGSSGAKGAAALARYRADQVNARHKAEVSAARSGGISTTQGNGGPR